MVRERKVLVGRITLSEACEQVRAKEQAASAKATDALGLVRLSPTTSAVGPARAAQRRAFYPTTLRASKVFRCPGGYRHMPGSSGRVQRRVCRPIRAIVGPIVFLDRPCGGLV
jgi:hypothetical protein